MQHAIWNGMKRLGAYPFAVVLAFLAINSTINLVVNPRSNPVHQLLSPWDYITAGLYGVGGLLIIIGIAFNRTDAETAGCIAFGGGALINALVWAAIVGWSAWNTVLILVVFAVASLLRAWHIASGRILVLVQVEDRPPTVVSK